MDRKYELLKDDHINYRGRTLYRIKALKDFGDIKACDLGGYIENEYNLSHNGECWVYNEAKVFGNALVYGNAKILGNARVYNNARVSGNAKVFGNARITCNARVCGSARIQEGDIIGTVSMPYKKIFQYQCKQRMLTAILTEDDKILYSIGCQENITEEEFIDRIHNTFGGLYYNPHRQEYLDIIKLLNIYL